MKIDENTIDLSSSSWSEYVVLETAEHIIKGHIFMPKIGQKSRLISETLNSGKDFIAVTNCELEHKNKPNVDIEHHNFVAVNISSILIMRPCDER